MKLEIDQNKIQEAASKAIHESMESAFGSYDVKNTLRETITNQLITAELAKAMANELEQKLDIQAVVAGIAKEFARNIVKASIAVLNESLLVSLVSLRAGGEYLGTAERAALREKIAAEMGIRNK